MTPVAAGQYIAAIERFLGGSVARQLYGPHVCMAAQPQTPNGNPDELVTSGVDAGAAVAQRWVDAIVRSLEHATTEPAIRQMLTTLPALLPLQPFADVVHGRVLSGCLLGGLDSQWERDHGVDLAPVRFDDRERDPHAEIARLWNQRKVLPRPAYDALDAGARRQAFTVAGLARGELLNDVHAELGRQLAAGARDREGPNLAHFSKFVDKRLTSAGWTPANASHVETIFRANVMAAYSAGRYAEMRQPAVLAAMPYWQIRTVKDSRQRATHRAADGIILPADHPFWRHAYPPFGYNCRCRVCARTKRWVDASNATIGPPPTGLPDPGFDSGTRTLISVPDHALPPAPQQAVPAPQPSSPAAAPIQPPVPAQTPALPFEPVVVRPPWEPAPVPPPYEHTAQDFREARISVGGSLGESQNVVLDRAKAASRRILGRPLTPQFVRDLMGAPDAVMGVEGRFTVTTLRDDQLTISARYGQRASITRDYIRNKRGELIVHHAYFKIAESAQAAGLGKRILANQVQLYEQLGVAEIETEAAWVGQYTWPRMGFALRNAAHLEPLKREFVAFLRKSYDMTEEHAALTADVQSIQQLAMVQLAPRHGVEPAELKVGKRFLLQRGHADGPLIELQIRRNGPEYAELRRYLNLPPLGRRVP